MTIINSLTDSVKTTIRKVLITATLVITDFMLFLLMTAVKITMKIYTSQSHHVKRYIQTTIKIKNIRPEKLTEIDLLIGNSAKKTSSNPNFRRFNNERGKRVGYIRKQQ